jgi:hypothetical protein
MTNFAHPHESTGDIEVAEKTVLEPKTPWAAAERVRPPWVPIKHGQTVLPPNDQKSNLHLSDEQVMKKRTEPIVNGSSAKPLSGAGTNQSDDFSFTKKTGGDF